MSAHHPPVPFWERLNDITLYPFRGAALIGLSVFSAALLLQMLPGIGFILYIVVWFAICRYAFEILVHTANGRMEAPEVTAHTDGSVVWSFLLLMLIYQIVGVLMTLLGGPVLGWGFYLLTSLMLPGAIISLAMDGVLMQALNPATPLAIMSRIGAPYFAVFGLIFVIQLSASTAPGLLFSAMPGMLSFLLAYLVANVATLWAMFATFHLMGYMVYQYHEVLGFDPHALSGDAASRPRNRDTDLMDAVQEQITEGNTEAALAQLEEEMRERAVSLDAHELYRKLLRVDRAKLLAHAGPFLNLLLLEKKERRALGLLRETLDIDPDFTPHSPEDAHALALRARDLGQSKLACDLWLAMFRRWPRKAERVDWALALAPLLAKRDQIMQARTTLRAVAHGLEDKDKLARIQAALAELPEV